jgi:hypothetical protein
MTSRSTRRALGVVWRGLSEVGHLVRAVHVHVDGGQECVLGGMRVDPPNDDEVFGKNGVENVLREELSSCAPIQITMLQPLLQQPHSSRCRATREATPHNIHDWPIKARQMRSTTATPVAFLLRDNDGRYD